MYVLYSKAINNTIFQQKNTIKRLINISNTCRKNHIFPSITLREPHREPTCLEVHIQMESVFII